MKTIVFMPTAARQLDALPVKAKEAIEAALERYAIEGRADVK